MVFLEPEYSTTAEKRPHLITAVVEYVTVPVRMKPFPWVLMFIKVGSVKKNQAVKVIREI